MHGYTFTSSLLFAQRANNGLFDSTATITVSFHYPILVQPFSDERVSRKILLSVKQCEYSEGNCIKQIDKCFRTLHKMNTVEYVYPYTRWKPTMGSVRACLRTIHIYKIGYGRCICCACKCLCRS